MSTESIQLAVSATYSLFQARREYEKPDIAYASRANLDNKVTPAYNTEISMLTEIAEVVSKHTIVLSSNSYWLPQGKTYDPVEIYATAVQFFDCHDAPLPQTTLPPSKDVQEFIDNVLKSNKKLSVSEQLDILLDITNGNILGAANIGMLGSRILARGWDNRAYPEIVITPSIILDAPNHLAPFEGCKESLGDTYYFWTNFFATCSYNQLGDVTSRGFNKLFMFGTPVMRFVREYIVGQPTVSSGCLSSDLGRLMGDIVSIHLHEIINQMSQVSS